MKYLKSSKSSSKNNSGLPNTTLRTQSSAGFTIIEIMVVLAVSVMLMTIFAGFSRRNNLVMALASEQLRLMNTFAEAKSLALQTFISDLASQRVCGYGIHLASDLRSYTLFRDLPNPKSGECISNNIYSGNRIYDSNDPDELIATTAFTAGIKLAAAPVENVFFLPPDPQTFFTPDPGGATVTLTLTTDDGAAERKVKVTKAGQLSAE